ncbi:isochorismatase family protein [Thaumasiovibrio subtropicus]|uniref:isochorismatase family protein n=1 Tax=Thaumasiovibrio subtropicus TaxID=1891207 RepID=UPI000B3530EC|nr:isochorismatase family protein [Thaumasiovibrio subtropicus]
MATNKVDIVRERTATLDVDPQKGFSELCPKELPVTGALEIVPQLLANHTFAAIKLVSRDMHPTGAAWEASTPAEMLSPVDLPEVDVKWNPHCVMGTEGVELLPGLPPVREYDFQINKGLDPDAHPYGAFYHDQADTLSTGGLEFLQVKGIDTVLVGGLALDFCVKKSVEQLLAAGLRVVLNLAATRAVFPEQFEQVANDLQAQGVELIDDTRALSLVDHV